VSISRMPPFLARPGSSGPVGALMDEYARAAADLCDIVETFSETEFDAERESDDPDTVSACAVARHVCSAAFGYADYLRKALEVVLDPPAGKRIAGSQDVRERLAAALRYTEHVADYLRELSDDEVMALTFEVRWGPTYNPETLLEHAICHLLRHRRQLERWSLTSS